jgi:myo-inositol catabolism protein IolC
MMMKEFTLHASGMSLNWIIELVVKILSLILPVVTPSLRAELEKFLLKFYEKAKETPNPWDDFLAKFLMRILGMEIPE